MSTSTPALGADRRVSHGLARALRSPSLRLIGRRLAAAIPVLWGVTLLTFLVLNIMPGSAAQQLLGADATPEQVRQLEAELNLDQPAWVRYWEWLQGVVTGDLGNSIASGQPVTTIIGQRLPVSVELVLCAIIVSLAFTVPLALMAARRPNGIVDRLSMVLSMTGLSIANYVFALVLVVVFAVIFPVLPAIGFVPLSDGLLGNLRSLILPAIAIGFPLFCFYTRFLRGDLVEQMRGEDYVVTAKAKGVGPWRVLIRHAFRNSLFGLLTIVGLNLGTLIGATVIIEQIFALPGIGQELLQAINNRDAVVVQAIVLLLAVVVVVANLITDLLYAVLDPRIRYGQRSA
ncbi:MAG: ABC transporter permease subunit [Streptosporangiales bacterium]|nr:ABC transporter permease subunit [Streptosporangiales bacterium]